MFFACLVIIMSLEILISSFEKVIHSRTYKLHLHIILQEGSQLSLRNSFQTTFKISHGSVVGAAKFFGALNPAC